MSSKLAAVDVAAFAATQLHLLDAELQSEILETSTLISGSSSPSTLQRAGVAITNLVLSSQRTGLGGKTVLELALDPAVGGGKDGELPEHGIRVGDIVAVAEPPSGSAKKREIKDLESKGSRGVVTKVGRMSVNVALDKEEDVVSQGRLWVVKLANDVTYKRLVSLYACNCMRSLCVSHFKWSPPITDLNLYRGCYHVHRSSKGDAANVTPGQNEPNNGENSEDG